MINSEELDPQKPTAKKRDLEPMSIEELQDYITVLEQEIMRAEALIDKKQQHKTGIEALFGRKD